jgi:hypothetical protein
MSDDFDINTLNIREQILHNLAIRDIPGVTEVLAAHLQDKFSFKFIENDKDEELWLYDEGIYKPNGKTKIKHHARKLIGKLFTTHLTKQVIAKICAEDPIKQEDFFDQQNKDSFYILKE